METSTDKYYCWGELLVPPADQVVDPDQHPRKAQPDTGTAYTVPER